MGEFKKQLMLLLKIQYMSKRSSDPSLLLRNIFFERGMYLAIHNT